jgi:hypothetical protein
MRGIVAQLSPAVLLKTMQRADDQACAARTLTTISLVRRLKTKSATAALVQAEPISPTARTESMAAVIASPDRPLFSCRLNKSQA